MTSVAKESVTEVRDAGVASSVKATMQKASRIATLPAVTARMIQLCNNPETVIEDVVRIIDPVLAIKILRLVNSAFYGVPGQIKSIKHAILMLGMNAVKNIAIAASLVKMVRGGRFGSQFNAGELWSHSIAVATAARLIAQKTNQKVVEEAFLAGLIHDIGIIVEMQACQPEFVQLLEQLTADSELTFRAAEIQTLGASHEDLGAELCAAWNLPTSLQFAVGYHHRPGELPEARRELPLVVHLADILAARSGIGYSRTVETDFVDASLFETVRVTDADLELILERLPDAIQESKKLLSDDN